MFKNISYKNTHYSQNFKKCAVLSLGIDRELQFTPYNIIYVLLQ